MNTTVNDDWTARELNEASPILKKAFANKDKDEIRPRQVVKRITIVLVVFSLALIGLFLSLIAIRTGKFVTPDQQAFAGFVILLSVGLIAASLLGLVLSLWNAFVASYLQSQAWKFEAAEATDQVHIIVESVAAGAAGTAVSAVVKTTTTFPIDETLARAVSKAVSKADAAETQEMVTAFRQAAE
jgi:hypothetical protein